MRAGASGAVETRPIIRSSDTTAGTPLRRASIQTSTLPSAERVTSSTRVTTADAVSVGDGMPPVPGTTPAALWTQGVPHQPASRVRETPATVTSSTEVAVNSGHTSRERGFDREPRRLGMMCVSVTSTGLRRPEAAGSGPHGSLTPGKR